MARQLSFDLAAKPALGREDFFVSPANALAVALVEGWRHWPGGKMTLSGPAGSGKTHLAHVWAAATGARIIDAAAVAGADIPALAEADIAVEDVPAIAGDARAERALFHLHNLVLAQGHRLMMTGRGAASGWPVALPDLKSRIDAASHAALEEPDDLLLAAVLAKLFTDRQIVPRPDVIPYLVQHMDRSFAAAAEIVERLDRAALARGTNVTRPLAMRLLGGGDDAG